MTTKHQVRRQQVPNINRTSMGTWSTYDEKTTATRRTRRVRCQQ